ncbi:TVP38/TMEM64 family protein [Granulosicoccus antarcticus]|uniref:TVP38/TMEM64 family membrane protein n=1 Tax=Granulosicoccus antarcticus IMCC3135 TaxID=1192854 RepID=A0A2Z2NW40_9GAMM|nr:VTT domain-containing protein [Granulosicoccus antarcticus]ASJ75559.1 hypothetical protein IMCC3135_27525 [Granulosicoccus antarcticus IMCC3135]
MSFASRLTKRHTALILVVLLLSIILLTLLFPPSQWIPAKQWGHMLESAGAVGAVVFVAVSVVATSVGLPRQLVAFIGGLAYGVMPGLLLALVSALAGCYLTVSISTAFFSERIRQRFPAFISRLELMLENDVFIKVLILRLQPLGTNLMTNVCIGFTQVPRWKFLLASAIGYVPQMLVFVLLGAGIRLGSDFQLTLSVVLMVVSVLLGIVLFQLHKLRLARK